MVVTNPNRFGIGRNVDKRDTLLLMIGDSDPINVKVPVRNYSDSMAARSAIKRVIARVIMREDRCTMKQAYRKMG